MAPDRGMPDVSVVITTYNRARLLQVALRSALGQRDVDHEVIVVDNGSSDGTRELLRALDDPRLRVIRHEQTLGATGGRNSGLAAARGHWRCMIDDDDVWAPDKLSAQLAELERTGRSWSYTGCVYIDSEHRLLGGVPPPTPERTMQELPVRYVVQGGLSSLLWRSDALDDGGRLDARLSFTDDWDVCLRLARTGPPAVVRRPLVAYRQHGANRSHGARQYVKEFDIIAEKHADQGSGDGIDLSVQERFFGSQALRNGDRREAALAYWRGLRMGDLGCLLRAPALLVPTGLQPWLRRRFLSDSEYLREAEAWL